MKRFLISLSAVLWFGCGDGDNETVDLTMLRVGGTTFDANNNGTLFPIVLTEGELSFEAINLVSGGEVPLLGAETSFDFFTNDTFRSLGAVVPLESFNPIHVIPVSGADSIALRLEFSVTLSDLTVVNGQVNLSFAEEDEQILDQLVDLTGGGQVAITLAFDPARTLDLIDLDLLGADGDFVIEEGTADPDIDAALVTLEENLLTSFAFVSLQ